MVTEAWFRAVSRLESTKSAEFQLVAVLPKPVLLIDTNPPVAMAGWILL
jgi:hypothetical protein